jgi:hypothetical protein
MQSIESRLTPRRVRDIDKYRTVDDLTDKIATNLNKHVSHDTFIGRFFGTIVSGSGGLLAVQVIKISVFILTYFMALHDQRNNTHATVNYMTNR